MTNSKPEYGMAVSRDVMMPMRDGVRLAADIYRPAHDGEPAPGRFPTILVRTSYDKTNPVSFVRPVADFFTPHGYAVVLQDLRGRRKSEGAGQYFHTCNPTEGPDGYDTIEWIASQPWSNGRVGMVGSSHGAMVQTIAALQRPPHLTAIWPDVGPTKIYAHEAREGGAMALHMFGALFLHAHDAQEIRDDARARASLESAMERLRELVLETPFVPGKTPLAVVPNLEKTLFDYYYRGEYDGFWSREWNDFEAHFDRHADIPGTYSGGWFDPFAAATTGYFAAMAARNTRPQRLIMGPWTHGGMRGEGDTWAGEVDFGAESRVGDAVLGGWQLRWFDRWLRDIENGVEDDPPVRIFVMGGGDGLKNREGRIRHGGRWRDENEWPLARTRRATYYLRAGGGLSTEQPSQDDPPARFTCDPDDPVPTISGDVTGMYELVPIGEGMNPAYVTPRARMRSIVTPGPTHQIEADGVVGARPPYRLLSERPDVLVFQTEPLQSAVEVTGPVSVNLWVSSSAVDTDFTAKLLDVYPPSDGFPDGFHMNLVDSIIRCRFRDGWEKEKFLKPGEVCAVRIDLHPTSNLFAAGHRIRLDVSGSNFPRFDLNPNTGEPMGRHTHMLKAENAVYLDASRPSHVVLPVIPAG